MKYNKHSPGGSIYRHISRKILNEVIGTDEKAQIEKHSDYNPHPYNDSYEFDRMFGRKRVRYICD